MQRLVIGLAALAATSLGTISARAEDPRPAVVFMEPGGSGIWKATETYRVVSDAEKLKTYNHWLENDWARRALDLYTRAWSVAHPGQSGPAEPYHMALIPDGNNADIGFRLQTDAGVEDHLKQPYVKLGPEQDSFDITLLHETGHVVLATLSGGREIPKRQLAAVPHTTCALSDRGTAFDEGFAIHLETLAAHLSADPAMRGRYRHERVEFGADQQKRSEYHRHAVDLLSYSQTTARYYEVRENNFAFAPAFRGPDYLRVQLDKSRDFATLRDADQLLQCEGFYAAFFFAWTVRGEHVPDAAAIAARQERILAALAELLKNGPGEADTPYLPRFVETYLRLYPDEAREIVDALMDSSHGVFVDAEAAALWQEYYLAALRLDVKQLPKERIQTARERWREAVLKDPQVLYSRLGPQLPCTVRARTVKLVLLGKERPLEFDLNTAEEGILRTVPGISDEEVARWLSERTRLPFSSTDDFKERVELRAEVLAQMKL